MTRIFTTVSGLNRKPILFAIIQFSSCLFIWRALMFVINSITGNYSHILTNNYIFKNNLLELVPESITGIALTSSVFITSKIFGSPPKLKLYYNQKYSILYLIFGFACGIIISLINNLFVFDRHITSFNERSFQPLSLLLSIPLMLFTFLMVSLVEETITRAYFFAVFDKALTPVLTWGTCSIFFGVFHLVDGQHDWWDVLFISVRSGFLFSAAFWLTRRIWLSLGMHWGYDFVGSLLFGDKEANLPAIMLLHPKDHLRRLAFEFAIGYILSFAMSGVVAYFAWKRDKSSKSDIILTPEVAREAIEIKSLK